MSNTLTFPVHVSSPELIRPAKPTPHETLYLSNIDDQIGLRNHIPFVHFYAPSPTSRGQDPVTRVKEALAKALVHYYPVAGRLRHGHEGKLVVECDGGGVIFRSAKAGVSLAEMRQVEGGLRPGFPHWDKLLVDDVWGSNFITDSPLLRVQVTTLSCGGIVMAYTFNHCICDAFGALTFMQTAAEFCRNPNLAAPSMPPAWHRELLKPRRNPRTHPHPEYDIPLKQPASAEADFRSLAQTSVFLSDADVALLKAQTPHRKTPTFDVIAACLWRARTRTLLEKNSTARLLFPVDTRFRHKPYLPKGYYGSAVVFPCIVAKIADRPFSEIVGLIGEAKLRAGRDGFRDSVLDFIEANGRRGFCSDEAFVVSDMTRLDFLGVDFGWKRAVFAGPARAGTGLVPGTVTSVIAHKNEKGVEGVLAMVSLPYESLERFRKEIRNEIDSASLANVRLTSSL